MALGFVVVAGAFAPTPAPPELRVGTPPVAAPGSVASDAFAANSLTRSPVNGADGSQSSFSIGDCGQVIQELHSSNAVIRSYAWDTTGRQLYAKSSSSVYYEITDPHGDVAALATATALAGTEHFDPWGNLYTSSGTTTPYGFQGSVGSWTDATSGLVSMGVRWYYPKVSRFLSSDPAAGTADPRTPIERLRWLYVINDPLVHDDPTGLNCEDRPCGRSQTILPEHEVQVCDSACYQRVNVWLAQRKAQQARENQGSPSHPACNWWCTAQAMGANFISHAAGSGNTTLTNMFSSTIDQADQFVTDPARVVGDVFHGKWADLPGAFSTYLNDSMQAPSNIGLGLLQSLSDLDPSQNLITLGQAILSSPDPVTAAGRAGDWYGDRTAKGALLGLTVGTALMGVDVAPAVADAGAVAPATADASAVGPAAVDAGVDGPTTAGGYGSLSRAGDYGVWPYRTLSDDLAGAGLRAHHLIEKRFADVMGQDPADMESAAVTQAEHQVFTNAWRSAISYGDGTANATRAGIEAAARTIYAGYPRILSILGL